MNGTQDAISIHLQDSKEPQVTIYSNDTNCDGGTLKDIIGTVISEYEYEIEYEYDF